MKHLLFCVLALTLLSLGSCNKEYGSNIPEARVYLELYPAYITGLTVPMSYVIIPNNQESVYKYNSSALGFGGVLVYHGYSSDGNGQFYAFDLSCVNEANRTTLVEVDDTKLRAVCPKCGSVYNLSFGQGNAESGPATKKGFGLKPYSVIENGNKIYIQN